MKFTLVKSIQGFIPI